MLDLDATRRFRAALDAFLDLEPRLKSRFSDVEPEELQAIVDEVDAVLAQLDAVDRGHALVFKGHVLWWKHVHEVGRPALTDHPEAPIVSQGIACALEGRQLLTRHGAPDSIRWAEDVVRRLQHSG